MIRLSELGLIHTLAEPGEARYGLADTDHQHAVCLRCAAVIEVDSDAMRALTHRWETATGFAVAPGGVAVRGTCARCQRRR